MKKLLCLCAIVGAAGLLVLGFLHTRPQARRARLLARAGRDFSAGQFDAAEIEYVTLLRADRLNPEAIARLGIIYFDQGRGGMALPYLVEGRTLQPDNREVRLRLGLSYLAQGAFAQARAEADAILARHPRDGDAFLLLAEAAVAPADIADATRRLEHLPGPAAGGAPALVALGTLEFRQRHFPAAAARFQQALALDPTSSDAWTARAALDWSDNDLPHADQAFARAVALAPGRLPKQLQYAEFKVETGARDAARPILEAMTRQRPDFLPGDLLLAELDETEHRTAESAVLVAKVLDRAPSYFDALLLRGRLQLAAGQPAAAVAGLEKALETYRRSSKLNFELAQADLAAGASDKAVDSLNRALAWDPNLTAASLMLAELRLAMGDPASAMAALKPVIQQHPGLIQARFLLARTEVAQDDLDDALAEYRQLALDSPGDSAAVLFAGMILARQGRKDEARRDFDRALALAPDSDLALEQRVDLDLDDHRPADALARVQGRIAQSPARPELYVLLGRIFAGQHAVDSAATAFRHAISLRPGSPLPYLLLAELDAKTGQDGNALADLRELIARQPQDQTALMMMGTIQERDRDYAPAQATYEKLLAVDPNFSPALNNLACLDAELPGQLDRALDLAQQARKLLPADPRVADTLGWILGREHRYAWGLTLLQESAGRLPADPQVQFHLGMTYAAVGDEAAARLALQRALQLDAGFVGSGAARRELAALAIDPASAGPADRALLEQAAAGRPDDPLVLSRLAALDERAGDAGQAIAGWQAVLRQNPEDEPALVRLARLETARGDTARALPLARSAHALAPDDPEATRVLGLLAYRTGDYPWAVSLLTDTVDREPDDASAAADLARALKSLVLRYAAQPGDDQRALALAARARAALPADPQVARACGIIMYRSGNYAMAESLLAAGPGGADGELLFYLGMARYRLHEPSDRATLERAVALNPGAALAAQARGALASLK